MVGLLNDLFAVDVNAFHMTDIGSMAPTFKS
ncbi:hypothetical protein RCCS2_01668 [Roseobacter sp. CCS2]|nr:hypothetical protein RCCS2_01668 [Roseobacter sp. CCS2]